MKSYTAIYRMVKQAQQQQQPAKKKSIGQTIQEVGRTTQAVENQIKNFAQRNPETIKGVKSLWEKVRALRSKKPADTQTDTTPKHLAPVR